MIYPSRNRSTRRSLAAVSSLTLVATLSSALVVPARSHDASMFGVSSTRKSINFGPTVPSVQHSTANPNAALSLYNVQAAAASLGVRSACATAADELALATCVGAGIAHDFLAVLHPGSTFRLVSGYPSAHNGVFHAHFIQLVNGIPVANANLNVNVHLPSAQVLSYGDSSLSHAASVGSQLEAWKAKVASWAGDAASAAGQVVLGGTRADADEFATPPLLPAGATHDFEASTTFELDPRHGLIAFLALQSPEPALTEFLINAPRAELLDLLALTPTHNAPTLETVRVIENVPTALAPVKASLA